MILLTLTFEIHYLCYTATYSSHCENICKILQLINNIKFINCEELLNVLVYKIIKFTKIIMSNSCNRSPSLLFLLVLLI